MWAAACSDKPAGDLITAPALDTRADSVPQIRSGGSPIRVASPSDAIVLPEESGFTVTFVSRDCTALGNKVTLTSPISVFQVLLTDGCSADFPQTWPFASPFPAGTVIDFLFEPRRRDRGDIQVSGDFPVWTLNFEDGIDADYDDLVFTVTTGDVDFCTMFDEEVNDPLLRDLAVEEILIELAVLSNFVEPFASRRGRGGYIVEQPDGAIDFLEHRYLTSDGTLGDQHELCVTPYDRHYADDILAGGGRTILGQIHTHATGGGIETNPGTCNKWTPKSDGTYDVRPIPGPQLDIDPGPSPLDLTDWWRGDAPWPGYMMSPDRVYRWASGETGLIKDDFKLKKGPVACIAQ